MQQPTRLISTPFAQEGEKTDIQNVTGESDNSATYRVGFPPITMQSIRLGGKPPKGMDFNGVLFDITENISFLCKGGRYQYSAGLSTLIGGYPEGSNLLLDDNITEVVSEIASNQNNPNTNMTGWKLKPTKASSVLSDGNQNQQQINDFGGAKWYAKSGGYKLGATVKLENGDTVQSTAPDNTVNPNVDMTGWVKTNSASQITTSSGLNQEEVNASKASDVEVLPSTQTKDSFKNAYSTQQSNLFEQLRAMSACGRCYIWKNPLHAAQADYRFSFGINMSGFKTAEWKFVADADNFIRMEYGYTGAIRSPTGFTDATNKVGTVSGGASNNAYFATVDSSFDLVFTGTGLLINQFVDANGGIFDVYLDGVLLRKMSCNINNPENAGAVALNIQKLVVSDLSNTEHTVKFIFKGADPLYPPTTSARGWFKNFTGSDTHTAAVITGAEMGMSSTGAKLVANGIIDFAISSRAFGTSMPYDWTPSHSGAAGAMVVHSRKMYIDNTLIDDALTVVSSEKEFKELTIIQKYTAYNSNDTSKAYPLYTGTLITKFDRNNGLSYSIEINTVSKLDVSEGFMSMLSGRRTSDLLKFEADNGQTVDLSGANPSSDIQTYTGVLKSARWLGNNTGLAISVDSPESSSSLGRTFKDVNPTLFNQRSDGFCKLYFKTFGRNSTVEAGIKLITYHKVWLATF